MNASITAALGVAFGVVGTGTVFLMFHLWGYPFDKATRTSAAPRSLMLLHRGLGYLYFALYVVLMTQMVPRLFSYQVEFPPRTVAHIVLGITVGFLLLIKISIIRFFRHLEEWMPFLGTGLLLCTYLLLGLSVPFTFRERMLRSRALGGDAVSAASLERVQKLLPGAGLPTEAPLAELATSKAILAGREVLLTKCVKCHDLKTILTRPRTPKDWARTVGRMADRPVFGDAIAEREQWNVTAYLIAISPELQDSAKRAREQAQRSSDMKVAAASADMETIERSEPIDIGATRPLFEQKCNECHTLKDVEDYQWSTAEDAREVITRMVDNGLEGSPAEIETLYQYVVAVYANSAAAKAPPVGGPASTGSGAARAPHVDVAPAASSAAPATAHRTPGGGGGKAPAPAVDPAKPAAAPAEPVACGSRPLPDCPLQGWMKSQLTSAVSSEDYGALSTALDRLAKMAPPGYAAWASISSRGAAAARASDLPGVKTSCTGCHTQFRARYKSEMRGRPLP